MASEQVSASDIEGPESVVVVGASVGGLFAALALARSGCAVTLLERDEAGLPVDVDAAFSWQRPGTPQLHHTHFFLTRLRVVLRDHFPDVLEALHQAGATERLIIGPGLAGVGPSANQDGPEDLRLLAMRRTSFEWVLRRKVTEQEGIRVQTGAAVTGLTTRVHEGRVTVTGVELDDGANMAADAVVATTGRRGDVAGWLARHGVTMRQQVGPSPNIVYFTRFYQLAEGEVFPATGTAPGRGRAGIFCGVSPADNGTYSVIVAVDSSDKELRGRMQDPGSFVRVAQLFPETAPWLRPGLAEPVTDVHVMAGLMNRTCSLITDSGDPMVEGFHCLGDAHTVSNPLYGRGCTLAAIQAVALADAFAQHPGDPDARSRDYGEVNSRLVRPWYHLAVEMDLLRRGEQPTEVDPSAPKWPIAEVLAAATSDPAVGTAWARVAVMLDEPSSLFDDPDLLARVTDAGRQPAKPRPARRGSRVTRADLLRAAQQPVG